MTTPYSPYGGFISPLRALYASTAQALRAHMEMDAGAATASWEPVSDILDPYFPDSPGVFGCRADLMFVRQGKDAPMPVMAGRAPDRIGVLFCDLMPDPISGQSMLKAGDRVQMLTGPVSGVFEIKSVPDVAVAYAAGHHVEVQIVEVAQGAVQFPGSQPS